MEELYNQLNKEGKYTKSFENFQVQFGTPEKSEKLYSALNQAGDYTKSFDDFKVQFNVLPEGVIELTDEQVGKTNDSANVDPAVESENNTDSQSANGLSELKETEPISNWQSIKNSFSNMGEQVGDVYEYWFEDEGANAALDIATNSVYSAISGQDTIDDFVKEQGKDSWMAEGLGSEATLEAIKKYEIEQSKTKKTKGVIESFKDGNIGGVLAGTINALTSMVGSVAYGAGTLGTGFFMDYVAENYIEYNKLKAENLGVTLPELITSGEADNAIPVGMGALSTGLELIGLGLIGKGVKGAVKGKGGNTGLLGSASKYLAEKLIYSKGARATMNVLGTGATEFTTEILQHASDQVNLELGRVAGTDEEAQIGKTFIDAVTSEEGLEAGIQGFLGGAGMTTGSYSAKAMNTIRNVVDEDAANKSLIKLGTLEANLKAATDPTVRKGIEAQIEAQTIEISDLVNKGNDIYNSLDDGDISKIENLRDLGDAALFQVTELGKKLRRGDISQKQYELSKGGFEIEYKAARQGLIDMELDKNIDFAKKEAESRGLSFKVYETTKAIQNAVNKLGNISQKDKKVFKDSKGNIHGFSIGNKILINKEVAKKEGAINVGSHEVLHPVFNKLIGNVAEQGKIVKQFRKSMTSTQRSFVDKQMKDRGYTSPTKYNTEYINVFADALRKKQINYDKTTFEKIGDAIVGIFKPKGYENVSFDNGQDVYNFVKEYDISAEQGQLTEKAAKAIGDVDLSDAALKSGEVQLSKSVAEAEVALQEAQDADPNDPRYFDNLDKAEAELDAAEDAINNPQKATPEVKKEVKPKTKVSRPEKPIRTTELGPRDPISKKIMDTYNEGMEGVERPEYKANKPLPASLERKLVPMFEGYINTIVQQKFKQLGPEALEFQDALSILRAEVVSAIRTFNPKVNKDLAGYVKRYGVQARQSLMFKDANTEFTSDLDDAKTVTSTTDVPSIDRSGTVERGQATFDELDIVDDALIENIKNDLEKEIRVRVQKGTLSETVSVKKGRETYIVSWLENYVNKQLFKKLLKKVGAITGVYPNAVIPGAYIDFLNDPKTFDIVTKALPIKSIKKSYGKLFPIERVGRELTAEGNPVFRIKPIDKKTFLTYFVKGKKSAVLERQKQLFREILEPLAKQIVADYATPENLSELKSIQELAPDTSQDVQGGIIIEAQLNELQSQLDRYKGEQSGFDIIQFSKNVNAAQKENITNALTPLLSKPSANDFKTSVVEDILEGLKDVKTFEDLAKLVWNAGNTTLSKRSIRMYRAELLSLLTKKLNYTDTVKFLISAISASQRVYKYQQKVIGFDYSLANFKSSLNNVSGIKAKAEVAQLFLKYISRSIRTLGLDGITKNSDVYKSILKPILSDPTKYGFDLEVDEKKNRSYIRKDGIRLQGLADITNIKANFKESVNTINKEATEVRAWLFGEAEKAIFAKDTDAFIGLLSLMSSDQRGVIRKMNSAGFAFEGLAVKDSVLEHETEAIEVYAAWKEYVEGVDGGKTRLNKILDGAKVNLVSKKFDALLRKIQKETGLRGIARYKDQRAIDFLAKTKLVQFSKSENLKKDNDLGVIQFSKTLNKAKAMVNKPDAPVKGISVWDFDDTLATTKSNVLYTMPDGTKGKIDATEFALNGDTLAAKGAEFDFSEFSKVMQGAKGPMFDKAIARNKKFGNSNVYILTARPANSKYAIHEFLKGIGLDIKLENIFGLGDGTAIAKAKWVVGKVAEGYNDFYFADDAYKNVKAVQEVLEQADVKSKVHQAKVQFSKNVDKEFNNIIEGATGIESKRKISGTKGKVLGRNKGRFKFFIPPSADDFAGLLYRLLGKGKEGDVNSAWFKESLFDPFAKGIRDFETYKQVAAQTVKQLKKGIKNIPQGLTKINETGFTNGSAVRVYLWVLNGYSIPDLSAADQKELVKIVNDNPDLKNFANELDSALDGYPEPQGDWLAGTITTDTINMVNTVKRAEFLEQWQANADVIFSKENLNKLRAAYGDNYVEALQDMLYRMKTGRNRPSGSNKLTNQFMNWVNDSVGTIMFFNTRSAVLQLLSMTNFINWADNNPAAAASAFANQKQFWSDFSMLFNSDFLKQRRSGLKTDVNADDIASAAEGATNKVKAAMSAMLKAGFLPTQMADSFAIAMGGASFVRNRINKYVKEGLSQADAKEQAFLDFQEIAEETQQSSRPDRVSQQQASPLGRIILAFANTPMQYMRLTKKSFLDLVNGRGDAKTNISRIVYYMAVQNMIFSGLQAALFASLFEDEDEDEVDAKELRIANSMLDSILRGVGIYGAIAATGKNIVLEIDRQANKDRPDYTQAALRALDVSPPISSKMRKLMSAGRAFSYKSVRDKMTGVSLENPAFYAGGQVVSALTNVPLDRAIKKADNLRVAVDGDTKLWQSIALALGYSQWDLGLVETSKSKSKKKKKNKFGTTPTWKRKVKGDGGWKKRN